MRCELRWYAGESGTNILDLTMLSPLPYSGNPVLRTRNVRVRLLTQADLRTQYYNTGFIVSHLGLS